MFALNSALMADGVVIDIAKDASPAKPLHIVHIASGQPAAAYTRSLLRVGANVSATLVESFFCADGAQAYQVNDATMIAVGDGAQLDHVRLMEDGREAFNISTLKTVLGRNATYKIFNLTSGAAVSRYQGLLRFDGEGSRVETYGVNLLNETQHGDTTLVVDHAVPHCASREVFRAVIDDRGALGVPGQDHRPPRCAEDRRQDGDAGAAALRRRRDRQQAGARDFRRRRDLRSRRDRRRAGRDAAVLPAGPRPAGEGSAGASDPGVRRRGDRGDCGRPAARGCNQRGGAMAGGEDVHDPSGGEERSLRRRQSARGFPRAGAAGLRQAAGLSRQRRLRAEADFRARPHAEGVHVRICQRASRAALSRQRRDRSLRRRARKGREIPQRGAARGDLLHPQRHRGDQPGRVVVCRADDQGRRRDRPVDHGAPFQHRAVAFPARTAGRGAEVGAGRRRGQLPARRVREAA